MEEGLQVSAPGHSGDDTTRRVPRALREWETG
jgi:hypothetical protein